MNKYVVMAPVVEPLLAFSDDERKQRLADNQENSSLQFYRRLLSRAAGVEWWSKDKWLRYVFSQDTIKKGEYRVSVFSRFGEVPAYHESGNIDWLLYAIEFPFDGRFLTVLL